jgi:hypothetical protein
MDALVSPLNDSLPRYAECTSTVGQSALWTELCPVEARSLKLSLDGGPRSRTLIHLWLCISLPSSSTGEFQLPQSHCKNAMREHPIKSQPRSVATRASGTQMSTSS